MKIKPAKRDLPLNSKQHGIGKLPPVSIIRFIAMLVFLPWFSACTFPPSNFPFEVHKKGEILEFEYQITSHNYYSFNLWFMFKEGDQQDRYRVKKLVGGLMKKNGEWVTEPGVPISLRFTITIIDDSGERLLFDEEFLNLELTSWGGTSFKKDITTVVLKPGKYRFRVESLKDAPELLGTSVRFNIGVSAKTSPNL